MKRMRNQASSVFAGSKAKRHLRGACRKPLRGPERLEDRLLLSTVSHSAVVSENPADITPHIVLDSASQSIYDFEQIGRTMFAGGRFDEVQDSTRTTTYSRPNFVAFDADTGIISPLNLSFDGVVTAIEASEDETALFISGAFSHVNGITRRGIAKYDLVNDRIDPTFAPTGMRTVSDIKLANGSLIAAGNFSKNLMAMDPTTGADLGTIDITFDGVVDPTDETRVKKIAVSPDGTQLVGTGNFASINGQPQKLAFMLNLGSTATLSPWHAPRFDVDCPAISRLSAQGIDFSPDGSYFVIVATGGKNNDGICDSAARFESANESSTVEPTWINFTGGDTLYSVAITDVAVYVGGHQRWLDNPLGNDSAGPGALSRPGVGAIDPTTGQTLSWNPTKSRNHGTLALFATPDGFWVGSDGERFGHEDHVGIGFAPLDLSPTPDTIRPDTFIDSGPAGLVSETSATFSFSASEQSTFQCRLDSEAFAPCTSEVSYDSLVAGSHTFQVAAIDASFNMDASPAVQSWTVVAPGTELIGNSGFELNTSGWKGDVASNTLTRVAGGHSGGWAAEVTNTAAGGKYGLDDSPNWVTSTQDGSYTTSIWARSNTPGGVLKMRVREYMGGSRQGTVTETLALTNSWQQLTANYTPVVSGSSLDFEVYSTNAPAGASFQLDDASITLDIPNNDAEILIAESGGSTDVTEDGVTDSYEVVLSTAPTADVTVTVSPDGQSVASTATPGVTTVLAADFDTDDDGFSYVDDSFRGTAAPNYASGVRLPSGGFSGGGLQVTLGGIDSDDIFGMSGGWQQSFTLDDPTDVTFSFNYNLTQAANYESDEFSQTLVSIDGVLYGNGSNDYLTQLTGDGNGGNPQTTGWQNVEFSSGILAAGTHTINIGAYNNKKTFDDETTTLLIDDVAGFAQSSSDLIFTPSNWSFPQTVTVAAVDDALLEGPHTSTISHTSSSTDPNFDGLAVDSVVANITDNETPAATGLLFSLKNAAAASLPGGLTVENEDIVAFDGTDFNLLFDGSDVGISGTNVDALAVIDTDEILLSFTSPEIIPGIAGTVEDSDIVKFTATQLGDTTSGTFELFFRGSDLGLSPTQEDIDAVDLHTDGRLIVSTTGNFDVPGLSGSDEDLLAFTPLTPGDYSTGTWAIYFDGSDVELTREDVYAVSLDPNGAIHLSTTNAFAVTGISGEDEDAITFTPSQLGTDTTGTYSSTLLFDGSKFGLAANDVNAIDLSIPAPPQAVAALAGTASANFNADNDADNLVAGADFLSWQRGFGITSGASTKDGDATRDGKVNRSDLAAWESLYGSAQVAAAAGPELTSSRYEAANSFESQESPSLAFAVGSDTSTITSATANTKTNYDGLATTGNISFSLVSQDFIHQVHSPANPRDLSMSEAIADQVFADYANRRRLLPERSTEADRQISGLDQHTIAVPQYRDISQVDDLYSELGNSSTDNDDLLGSQHAV